MSDLDYQFQQMLGALSDTIEFHKRDILVFDEDTKTLKPVSHICINGNVVQITTEKWGEDKETKKEKDDE